MIEATEYFEDRIIDLGGLRTGRTEIIHCPHCRDAFFQFYKAGGGNDAIEIDCNLDGQNRSNNDWDNLDINDEIITLTTEGITFYRWEGFLPPYISVKKVSGENQIMIKVDIEGVS